MATTLTLYKDRLRAELKIDPNGRVWSDTSLTRALNDALEQIEQDGNFDWPFNDGEVSDSTVIDQAAYALPTDFVRVELDGVKYNKKELTSASYNWLYKQNYFDQSGNPVYYALRGDNIYFAQKPSEVQTYEVLYRKKLTTMSANSDDPGLPTEFDHAMTKWAAYILWSTIEGRENKAISAAQDYQEAIKGLFDQYLGTRDDVNYNMSFEVPVNPSF